MTYREAVKHVLEYEIEKRGMTPASVSKHAGYAKNFLARFFSGAKRDLSFDALAPIASVLEMSVEDIVSAAEAQKRQIECDRQAREKLQTHPDILEEMSHNMNRPEEERTFLQKTAMLLRDILNPENHKAYVEENIKTFKEEPLFQKKNDNDTEISGNLAEQS